MNDQPLDVLKKIGSIHKYTEPKAIGDAVEQIEAAIAQVRDRFEALPNKVVRVVYALDVLQEILETAKNRAAEADTNRGENDDLFYIMGQWIDFVRDTTMANEIVEQELAQEQPTPQPSAGRFVCEN